MTLLKKPKYWMLLGIIASLFLLLGRFYTTKSIIGGDGVYYYMNLRSIVIDRDLDFKNEYAHYYDEMSPFTGNRKMKHIPQENPITHRLPNKYPIGNAIALLPFFYITHHIIILLNNTGVPVCVDGYGSIYQLMVAFGEMCYVFAGLALIYLLGNKLYSKKIALISATAVWGATPLIYYVTMEPLMAHALSMSFVTALIFYWYTIREEQLWHQWIVMGLLGGLISITRYQDALFLLIPMIDSCVSLIRRKPLCWMRNMVIYSVSAGSIISMQLYVNKVLYGTIFTTGYSAEGFPYWNSPKLLLTLFSAEGGLLRWSPILIFALIGLGFYLKRDKIGGGLLLSSFVVQWYLISSWSTFWQGDSFGGRMFLSCTPIFAIGLMEFLDVVQKRTTKFNHACVLVGVLIFINIILMEMYCLRIIGHPY